MTADDITLPDLTGRRVVVLGGTGGVGAGIVRAWLAAGASVVVPSRTQARLDELRSELGSDAERIEGIVGDYTSFEGALTMAERIGRESPVTDVIASLGRWWHGGPLWEITDEVWRSAFVEPTTAHEANVRAWIPELPTDGSYQVILGTAAFEPVPGSAVKNMEAAALAMMRDVLAAEAGDQRRVFGLVLGTVDTRFRDPDAADPSWIAPATVGALTAGIAASGRPSARLDAVDADARAALLAELGLTNGADRA